MPKKWNTTPYGFSLRPEQLEKLRQEKERTGLFMSEIVRQALDQYFAALDERRGQVAKRS